MLALRCFPPLVRTNTQVLVLGSLPGRASLQAGEYYAHPRNQFWRMISAIIRQPLTTLPYAERIESLLCAGVGLWDVIESAERTGSLDADLKQVAYNDLRTLIKNLPSLQAIAFNGKTAGRASRQLQDCPFALLQLPSSSPAFTMSYANKLALWREIEGYL